MPHILLVEPDAVLAETYRTALEADGHRVSTASTAQYAISAADEHPPDMVILELYLVRHNGMEFLYEFRSYVDWQHVPIILLTQAPVTEFADHWPLLSTELGVKKYLYKPQTSIGTLLSSIRSLEKAQT